MLHLRSICGIVLLTMGVSALSTAYPGPAVSAELGFAVTATLDGRPIPLRDVSKYYCDDFAFPVITCSATAVGIETRASLSLLVAAVDYVTIYDGATFSGAWMHVSQDYTALSFIGWNDRISSFKGRNAETGQFFLDWFYGGTSWSFCCNQQVGSLGTHDNSFSSIRRS